MSRTIKSAFAAIVLGFTLVPAALAEKPVSRPVSYADLNVASLAGATVLMHRIQQAAANVCGGGMVSPKQLAVYARYQACRTKAVEKAVRDVNAPVLTALYEAAGPVRQLASR